jgi:hypothetical protein
MRVAILLCAGACVFLLSGCQKGVKPEGVILKDGKPFVPGTGEFVQISLVAVDGGGAPAGSYIAAFDPDNSKFAIEDKRIPPGKYKVSVQLLKKRKDLLKGAFSPKTSPYEFDIESGSEDMQVDIAPSKGGHVQQTATRRSFRRRR